jgi:hypothetical protein
MAAYAAGSCREVHTSIYVFTLVGAVLLYLVIQWIAPIVPRPEFVSKFIAWIKGENSKLILKVKPFLADSISTNNEQEVPLALDQQQSSGHESEGTVSDAKDDIRKLRTYLLLLGILAATITYQAGLNPPGGFWLDNDDGHLAGDPILEAISPKRYNAFFYCNATAFVSSLVIITLLQSNLITVGALRRYVLQAAMIFDLFGMMGAYAAGSSRTLSTALYVIILVILVFSYVIIHILLFLCTRNSESAQQIDDDPELKDLEKRRKFLVLLAVLAASSTYQAGINPPGGFWTDNNDGHRAGYPMFHDEFPHRYMVFFYLNSTAFMSSLAVIMLLVSKRLCQRGINGYLLRGCMLLDLVSLMGAFAAGSCRKVSTSVYAILAVAIVFVYVMAQVLVLTFAKDKVSYFFFEWVLHATPFKSSSHPSENRKRGVTVSRKPEHKWRKDLILIGTLAVSVTYQAGLLPPGGLWPDDRDGHFIGDPILHDTNPARYKAFFYCNATAFMASVVIVILLLNSTISKYRRSLLPMKTAMVLDLLALLGAYAAGSSRKLKTSIYIFALFIAVFVYIVIHILLSFDKMARLVKKTGEQWIPSLKKMWALVEIEPPNHHPSSEEP